MPARTDPEESLTLDTAAMERATDALAEAFERGHRNHFCAEWLEDGTCTICWRNAHAVVLAAEGLRLCARCGGTGDVGCDAAVSCDECGGIGVVALESA